MKTYTHPVYPYVRAPDQDGPPRRWPVVVAGAGPVGLTAAIDLAMRGIDVLLLDDDNSVSTGSRAICWAKRTLEVFDRLGCGERVVAKGVRWNRGRVFFRDEQVFAFDLLAEAGHRRPAFVNLQQYWVEQILVERLGELACGEVRWHNTVVAVAPTDAGVALEIATPDGAYTVHADWLIAADGAKSPVRRMLALDSDGQGFRDRFLIVDVHMTSAFPAERWFWFDPPFHRHQSVLLHRQADDVWRIDFQLGQDADPEQEKKPECIVPRLQAMLGEDASFDIEWASVYTFACRRMRSFVHGRVVFVGDAAHVVSPFGARGANSGIQDADNLAWKLALVHRGLAPRALIGSYDVERTAAADADILHATRSTDFITPKSKISRTFRDAVLLLAKRHPFARQFVNSGRLSVAATLEHSPLNSPEVDVFAGAPRIGAVAVDAPATGAHGAWLLGYLQGGFTLLVFDYPLAAAAIAQLARRQVPCAVVQVGAACCAGAHLIEDVEGVLARRYDAKPGTCYLFRPDQHICARWRTFDASSVYAAITRATAHPAARNGEEAAWLS